MEAVAARLGAADWRREVPRISQSVDTQDLVSRHELQNMRVLRLLNSAGGVPVLCQRKVV